jgi:hypothetical protein
MIWTLERVDGANVVTDKGMVSLSPSQYADGGKTSPVTGADYQRMKAAFLASPMLLDAAYKVIDSWESGDLAAAVRELSAAVNWYEASARG